MCQIQLHQIQIQAKCATKMKTQNSSILLFLQFPNSITRKKSSSRYTGKKQKKSVLCFNTKCPQETFRNGLSQTERVWVSCKMSRLVIPTTDTLSPMRYSSIMSRFGFWLCTKFLAKCLSLEGLLSSHFHYIQKHWYCAPPSNLWLPKMINSYHTTLVSVRHISITSSQNALFLLKTL